MLLPPRADANPAVALYWTGDTSTDPTAVANWSESDGGGDASDTPDSNDSVSFTGSGNNDCTLTEDEEWGTVDIASGYTATLDLNDHDLTLGNGQDFTAAGGGTVDCGSGTISLTNGSFDNSQQTTWTHGGGKVAMGGVGTLTSPNTTVLGALEILSGATVTCADSTGMQGALDVDGEFLIASGKLAQVSTSNGKTSIGSAGRLGGDGTLRIDAWAAGSGITSFAAGGTIDVAELQLARPNAAAEFAVGTYSSTRVVVYNWTDAGYTLTLSATPGSGYVFSGDLEFENTNAGASSAITIANDTNDPDLTLQGDVIWTPTAGTLTYTAGTGTVTFSGASDQDIDFGGSTIEDVIVDKSAGTLTFSADCDPASITQTAGAIHVTNGLTITVPGNAVFHDDLIGDGGSFDLDVSGTNVAHDCTITNVHSIGTVLDATDNCIDGGGNVNVNFGVAATTTSRLSPLGVAMTSAA